MSTEILQNVDLILDRVKSLYNLRSDAELAGFLGNKPGTISAWRSRKSIDLPLVLAKCREANAHFVVFGLGPKWADSDFLVKEPKAEYSTEFSQVEYYPKAYASAGHGLIPEEKEPLYLSFRSYFIKNTLGTSAKNLKVIRVKGDSMEPMIYSEDDILVDTSKLAPRFGPAFLIRLDDVLHCKLIQTFGDERWKIMSKNDSYESFDINPKTDPVEIIGEVVWWGRKSPYI